MAGARPGDVPKTATQLADGTWCDGKLKSGKREGSWKFFTAEGEESRVANYTNGLVAKEYRYHEEGAAEIDWGTKKGRVWRYNGADTSIASIGEGLPTFPLPSVSAITFEILVTDHAKELFAVERPIYTDKAGKIVAMDGKPADNKPSATAVSITVGRTSYWQDGKRVRGKRDGVWTFWDVNGVKLVEARYASGVLESRTRFVSQTFVLEQVLGAKPKLVVREDDVRTEIEATKSQRIVRRTKGAKGKPKETAIAVGPIKSAKDFVSKFEAVFGQVRKLDAIAIKVGHVEVVCPELERYDDVIRISSLLSNGSGDELLVIEEPGKHQGRVFWNAHDEGLVSLEAIDEYVARDLPPKDKSKLVERLPFFQNPVADDLGELFARLEAVPNRKHAELFDALVPVKAPRPSSSKSKSSAK